MVELDDVPVQSLVPEPLRDVASVEDFMARLPQYDADMAARLDEASDAGECLRFVGEHGSLLPLHRAATLCCSAQQCSTRHLLDQPKSHRECWTVALLQRCACHLDASCPASHGPQSGPLLDWGLCCSVTLPLRPKLGLIHEHTSIKVLNSSVSMRAWVWQRMQVWWTVRRGAAAWSCGGIRCPTPLRSFRAPTTSSPSPPSATRTSPSLSGASAVGCSSYGDSCCADVWAGGSVSSFKWNTE